MESLDECAAMGGQVEDESFFSCSSSEFYSCEITGNEEQLAGGSIFSSFELHTCKITGKEEQLGGSELSFPSPSIQWSNDLKPPQSAGSPNYIDIFEESQLVYAKDESVDDDLAEMELVKKRLSKLLLGEDMSGSGNGVSTALAISNAITNLSASVFGQLWRLEPLTKIKKSMWRREMECLLCVTDYITVLKPSSNSYPEGTKVEDMSCSRIPRADLLINLPALRKLDDMLLEILDSFDDKEFWYEERGLASLDTEILSSFRKGLRRQEEKWWLPVPQVPPRGLSCGTRKKLQNKRNCANQILKAVTDINHNTLADMEIPKLYLKGLPKHGRACVGDKMYRFMTSQNFSPEGVLDGRAILSENQALDLANRMEAAISVWHRKKKSKDNKRSNQRSSSSKSWDLVKEHVFKRELLIDRAEQFLLSLRQRFPGLFQTTLDTSKIQYNKDVGKAILESYSRVLESLAFSIMARVDDVLYVDDMNKVTDQKPDLYISQRFAHIVIEPFHSAIHEFHSEI